MARKATTTKEPARFGIRTTNAGIREAIIRRMESLGWNAYELHQRSGVGYASVKRFVSGERDMRTRTADVLIASLDKAEADTK